MVVVGLVVEAPVLPLQHGRHRRGELPVHPLGEALLDGLQLRRYQHPDRPRGHQGQVFRLGDYVDGRVSRQGRGQLLPEELLCRRLVLCQTQVVLPRIDLPAQRLLQGLGEV